MPKLMKTLFTWHGGAYTNTFNSEPSCGGLFSDCALTAGEDGQMTSQGIEIPSWTLVQQSDAGGIPVESFERTIEVPYSFPRAQYERGLYRQIPRDGGMTHRVEIRFDGGAGSTSH